MALPKITLQQLEYLDAVTRSDSWAAAADELGVSPSALSQGIAELERRLGISLFERQGRRRVLAADAAPAVAYARRVLAETRDFGDWVELRRSGRVGSLRVGMIDVGAVHHFPDQLAAFGTAHPDVELRLVVASSSGLLAQLAAGELDLVVCVDPASPLRPDGRSSEFTFVELLREPLAAYAPPGHKTGRPKTWGPWVTFPADSFTRQAIRLALRDLGAPFEVVAESHQPEVLREMVRLSLGWTVLPEVQAESGDRPLAPATKTPVAERLLVGARRTSATNPLIGELVAQLVEGVA